MKNIVICCDGTSNEFEGSATNVRKLSWILERNDPKTQLVFYDPGVGTFAPEGAVGAIQRRLYLIGGLAFGTGFKANLAEAYRCLMHSYEDGDRIFLFGFSRGAYTVRALAGMLHQFGLLHAHLDNLVPYIVRLYSAANFEAGGEIKDKFVRLKVIPIHFLGVWDTVSSLGFAYSRRSLPYTSNNPTVRTVRHAIAVDERRAYFRQNRWDYGSEETKDAVEVWFAGVHCDVGGGYLEEESGLSKVALQWMVDEATSYGLRVNEEKRDEIVLGEGARYSAPDPFGMRHRSLKGWWWILEYLPMNGTLARFRFSLPLGKRRRVNKEEALHQSVEVRAKTTTYRPPNLRGHLAKRSSGAEPERVMGRTLGRFVTLVAVVVAVWLLGPVVADLASLVWAGAQWAYQSGVVAVMAPIVVVSAGASWIDTASGMYRVGKGTRGRLPHKRIKPYSAADLASVFRGLRQSGRKAYAKALALDFVLVLLYGSALILGFLQVRHIAAPAAPIWLTAIPALTILADVIENVLLIRQVRAYSGSVDDLDRTQARLASRATQVKLVGFVASILLIVGMLLADYLSWPTTLLQ